MSGRFAAVADPGIEDTQVIGPDPKTQGWITSTIDAIMAQLPEHRIDRSDVASGHCRQEVTHEFGGLTITQYLCTKPAQHSGACVPLGRDGTDPRPTRDTPSRHDARFPHDAPSRHGVGVAI